MKTFNRKPGEIDGKKFKVDLSGTFIVKDSGPNTETQLLEAFKNMFEPRFDEDDDDNYDEYGNYNQPIYRGKVVPYDYKLTVKGAGS